MDIEELLNQHAQALIDLENRISETSTKIEVSEAALKCSKDIYESDLHELKLAQSDLSATEKELEWSVTQRKTLQERIDTAQEGLNQLRLEVAKKNDLLQAKKMKYNATLAKYDAIWADYQVTFKQYPGVAERDALLLEVKRKEIELRKKMQYLLEITEQAEYLKQFQVVQGRILTASVKDLYARYEESDASLAKLKAENEERKSLLQAKRKQKIEEEQKRFIEEEAKREEREKRKSQNSVGDIPGKLFLKGFSLDSLTPQDLSQPLKIPKFDWMDDATPLQPQKFHTPLVGLSQNKTTNEPTIESFSGVQNAASCFKQTLNAIIQKPHISNKSLETKSCNTLSDNNIFTREVGGDFLNKMEHIIERPATDVPVEPTAASNQWEEGFPVMTSSSSNCNMPGTPVVVLMPQLTQKANEISSRKIQTDGMVAKLRDLQKQTTSDVLQKEKPIPTDKFVAKLRDLQAQTTCDVIGQDSALQSHPNSISLENVDDNRIISNTHGSFQRTSENFQEHVDLPKEQSEEIHWTDENQDSQMIDTEDKTKQSPCNPSLIPSHSSNQNVTDQIEDDSTSLNADYDGLYDDNSLDPPPNFDALSTSDNDVAFTSSALSPYQSPSPPVTTSANFTEGDSQRFGGFSFFSNSNLYGGQSSTITKEENRNFFNF